MKKYSAYFAFAGVALFYCFEFSQMSYLTALAPHFLANKIYTHPEIASLSAAYYYGNVAGLLPAGYLLDHKSLRPVLLFAMLCSTLGAFVFAHTDHYAFAWLARFCCGFFGGAFSFIAAIRIISSLLAKRFVLFMGIFLTAGMIGGVIGQYPLLWLSNVFGTQATTETVFFASLFVLLINILIQRPQLQKATTPLASKLSQWQILKLIFKNTRNWIDCSLIVFIDSPFTIFGTLWGIVTLTSLYHFSNGASAMVMTLMFFGSIIGSLLYGYWAHRSQRQTLMVASATGLIALLCCGLSFFSLNLFLVSTTFFVIGFLTGTQTIVFSWLTQNMQPEFIGRNSSLNSMIFMGAGGLLKQICASLFLFTPIIQRKVSAVNLLVFMGLMMLIATVYLCVRYQWFKTPY